MKPLYIVVLGLSLCGCEKSKQQPETRAAEPMAIKSSELTFRKSVFTDLERKGAAVIVDTMLKPNEEHQLEIPEGSDSIGCFVDSQFILSQAGGFVRIYGSDGSESGVSDNVEICQVEGSLQASFKVVNEGKEPRRVLVYTITAEQVAAPDMQ